MPIDSKAVTPEHGHHDPDAPLIARLGAGDEAALAILMSRHLNKIHAAAYHMLGDKMAAEDVAQTTFLQLWKIAPQWETGRGKVLSYLYRVTSHRCLDILRKTKEHTLGDYPDIEDNHPSAFDTLSKKDDADMLKTALAGLPPRQRLALTLFYYQHQSLKQASEIMNITPTAFESLLRRARNGLKPLLLSREISS